MSIVESLVNMGSFIIGMCRLGFSLPVPVPVIFDPKTGGSGSGSGFFIRVSFQLFRFADVVVIREFTHAQSRTNPGRPRLSLRPYSAEENGEKRQF